MQISTLLYGLFAGPYSDGALPDASEVKEGEWEPNIMVKVVNFD